MKCYYNENDRFAAQWLRNLMAAGHIGAGDVDDRPIQEVRPADLAGYERCHFFAGIAGWEVALNLAGWVADAKIINRRGQREDDRNGEKRRGGNVIGEDLFLGRRTVWTGSCPCQPFSVAGKRRGVEDDRHLWPVWRELIAVCRPSAIFGEQVASKDGRLWLAGVRADLEALGYAVGAADLCAAGVGAPHIRQRLWWVADSAGPMHQTSRDEGRQREGAQLQSGRSCSNGRLGNPIGPGPQGRGLPDSGRARQRPAWASGAALDCLDGVTRRTQPGVHPLAHGIPGRVGQLRAYGNAIVPQVAAEFVRAAMESIGDDNGKD